MRVLGLDLGEKRIGLALSDSLGMVASPLKVLEYESQRAAVEQIAAIVKSKGVGEIVVGLPLEMNGRGGLQAEKAQGFAKALEERVNVPVNCWDERLTTVQAERALLEADVSRKGRKLRADMVAAALLLQSYLDSRRKQGVSS